MSKMRVEGVEITNPGKELFEGIAKRDYVLYHERVADKMMRHLEGRPLTLFRFPDGPDGKGFFQKNVPDYFPEWMDTARIESKDKTTEYVCCNDKKALIYLANQVSVLHTWMSRKDMPGVPDKIVFDFDPLGGPGLKDVAASLKGLLEEVGLVPFIMTTGGKGFHVAVPIERELGAKEVTGFAGKVAGVIADSDPRATTEFRKEKRKERVLIDVKRNSPGQTAVAPYSVRAKQGAPIATPIAWEELDSAEPDTYRLGKEHDGDPWRDFFRESRSLKETMEELS